MFGQTLIESSRATQKRKGWPMVIAFTAEAIIASVLIIVPLLSTGVIPVSARVPLYTPLKPIPLEPVNRVRTEPSHSGPAASSAPSHIVTVNGNPNAIYIGHTDPFIDIPDAPPGSGFNNGPDPLNDLVGHGPATDVKPGVTRITSVLSEAQLMNRVEPVYPRIAVLSGVQGQVKLHAIIARDGSIQSLNVISGHPLLTHAAVEAVEQWRYRPYYLNGVAVEVETLITVNFRKEGH
jgi:protein TonB